MHGPAGDYPSWIDVEPNGQGVAVTLVGNVGSAQLLRGATLRQGRLDFAVPAEQPGRAVQQYHATLQRGRLVGMLTESKKADVPWAGKPAPRLQRTVKHWAKPEILFDGKTFEGWHFVGNRTSHWTISDGTLVNSGHGSDIVTDSRFQDFELHVEWRCSERANSGIYLRGRYEVQLETDSVNEPASHHTGGIYGFLAPVPEQPRDPGLWQSFDIRLVGRTLWVVQNGVTIVNGKQIPGITGGALDSDEALPGPIFLQGGEDGTVEFRNLRVRRAASGA